METELRRRQLALGMASSLLTPLAGCAGSDDSVEIHYSVTNPMTHEEVPEAIVEHPNPDDFRWVAVEIEVVTGTVDASDIIGLTQLDIGDTNEFTRGVVITSPEDKVITSEEESHELEEGSQADAYYRVSPDANEGTWVVEQLDNQYDGLSVERN